MALISIKRNIDLQPGLNAPAVFNCSQSDKGTTIMLGLMNGGNDYTVPSGVTITIRGSRSNGAVFTPVSATSSGSTVSFTLTEEMTDTAGPTLCEAVLEQGNNVLGTANFIINVEGSPMGADVPPVFTDAAWTWMLGKLTTETVPALGDDVISSIQGKVDKSQGSTNAKKFLRVNTSGNVSLASTDKTLSVADQIADAKETGDQIRALDAEIDGVVTTLGGSISTLNGVTTDLQSSKLNKNQGTSNAGKTMIVDSSGNIVPGDVPITIDDTLSIADAAADAKAAGDAIALKANASTIAPKFSDQNTYTSGSYVLKNGVLYRFTAAHSGAWTGTDAEVVTVGGEVTYLNSAVSPLVPTDYKDQYTVNAYIDTGHVSGFQVNPNPVPYNGWAVAVIPCRTGDTFYLSGQGSASDSRAWAFTDSDYKIIINTGSTEIFNNYILVAPNDGYLIVNARMSINYGLTSPAKLSSDKISSINPTILVSKTATPSDTVFNTIKDAIDFTSNHANTTVFVESGDYDIIEELGGSDYTENLSGISTYTGGLALGNGAKIIGIGSDVNLIANYTAGTNQVMVEKFSIFNITGSFRLENINLEVTNVRYCVHEDTAALSVGLRPLFYIAEYINCTMKHNGTVGTSMPPICIGGGTMNKSIHIIDGCVLESPTGYNPAGYHNNSTTNNGVAHVVIRNTFCSGAVTFTIFNSNTQVIKAEVTGCRLGAAIIDNSSGLFDIKSWANEIVP